MSISSIYGSSDPSQIGRVAPISPIGTSQGTTDPLLNISNADSAVSPAAATQVSSGAKLYSRLQQLQSSDPAKFKQVVTDIANQLTAAAQNAAGQDQQTLQSLSDKFTKAESGDLSGFQPPQSSAKNPAAALYQQVASQNAQAANSVSLPSATGSRRGHYGHSGGASTAAEIALRSIFQELNQAAGSTSATASSIGASADAATPFPTS